MKKLFAFLMIFSSIAHAVSEISFSWSTPTTRADGTALDPGELAKYTLYFATGEVLAEITAGGSNQYVDTLTLSDGETVCFQITATDTQGRESDKSDIDQDTNCYTYIAPDPGVPTEFRAVFTVQ